MIIRLYPCVSGYDHAVSITNQSPIVKSDGSFRSFTAALVILEFSFATNSTTSASDNARHLAFEESSSSNNWKIRLAASNFLLMIFPIFSRSAVEMNWIFSTSATVFFIP